MMRLPLLVLLAGSPASSLAAESDARQASVPHLGVALAARDASPEQEPVARSVWPAPALAARAAAIRPLADMNEDEVLGSMPLDDFGRLLGEAGSGSGESASGPATPPASPPPPPPPPPSAPPSPPRPRRTSAVVRVALLQRMSDARLKTLDSCNDAAGKWEGGTCWLGEGWQAAAAAGLAAANDFNARIDSYVPQFASEAMQACNVQLSVSVVDSGSTTAFALEQLTTQLLDDEIAPDVRRPLTRC